MKKPLTYLTGDACTPQGGGKKLLIHVCNDLGKWGAGFVVPLGSAYPLTRETYLKSFGDKKGPSYGTLLGDIQVIAVSSDLLVVNMIAQGGIRSRENPVPLSYSALGACLRQVYEIASSMGASVHLPRVGCGLAGGSWERVSGMLEKLADADRVDTFVYDLPKQ